MISFFNSLKKSFRTKKVTTNYIRYNQTIGFDTEFIKKQEASIDEVIELSMNQRNNAEALK